MPCYEVNTVSQEFTGKSRELLKSTAKSLGLYFRDAGYFVECGDCLVNLENGTVQGASVSSINKFKRAYSLEAIKLASKKAGWTVSQKTTEKLTVRKW